MAAHQPAPVHVHTAAWRKLFNGLHAKEEPLLQRKHAGLPGSCKGYGAYEPLINIERHESCCRFVCHLHRGRPVGELLGEAGAQQVQQPGRRRQDSPGKWHSQAQAVLLRATQACSRGSTAPVLSCVWSWHTVRLRPYKAALLGSGLYKAGPADSCRGVSRSCCGEPWPGTAASTQMSNAGVPHLAPGAGGVAEQRPQPVLHISPPHQSGALLL